MSQGKGRRVCSDVTVGVRFNVCLCLCVFEEIMYGFPEARGAWHCQQSSGSLVPCFI